MEHPPINLLSLCVDQITSTEPRYPLCTLCVYSLHMNLCRNHPKPSKKLSDDESEMRHSGSVLGLPSQISMASAYLELLLHQ